MNLNTQPSERTNGQSLGRKEAGMITRTNNNVTAIAPEYCAYCQQELVHKAGVGHLAHEHKPYVTNKAGEPYVVAWSDHYLALVFHPNDIEHYGVLVSEAGDMTCRGKSDGARCWPFYNASTCVHCDAVQASIDCGERPKQVPSLALSDLAIEVKDQPAYVPTEPTKPARKVRDYDLESLYAEPLSATEVRRAAQYARTFGK